MRSTIILFSYLILLSSLTACLSSKPLDLKIQPEEDTFVYRSTNNTETDVSVMGMDQKVVVEQVVEQEYDIQETEEDGTLNIKMTTKSMKVDQTNPMMSMTYDSKNPDSNEPAEMMTGFDNMIGKEFDLKISPKGEILTLETDGGMFDGVFDDVPNGEALQAQMEGQFGVESIRSSMALMTGFYPDTPVKVGDTWTKMKTTTMGMQNEVETTYTLKERKRGIATIEFSSKIKSDPNAEAVEMMGMEMSYDLEGTQSGTIMVNEKTGWAKKTEGTQKMEGTMNMSGGQVGQMSADMKTNVSYTIERLDGTKS